jgi:carbamoyltransferase
MNIFFKEKIKSPFMNFVLNVKTDWIKKIPAVVNIDGTARVHSVSKTSNKLFYNLLSEFKKLSGIGMLLNTSFNENEPIVSHPQQAINCFIRTDLDYLCIGNFLIERKN